MIIINYASLNSLTSHKNYEKNKYHNYPVMEKKNNIINLQTHNEIWKWYLKKDKFSRAVTEL